MFGQRNLEKFEMSDGWTIYVKSTVFKTEVSLRNSEDEEELPWSELGLRKDNMLEVFSERLLEAGELEKIKEWLSEK
ncbi:hypothetical protein [uncultured Clostridium sp.]|jgi:hypothetical protein|uniref:hypothetical protein n=1 Tax=uncultured Clostridium sp. TaxID=59620 RepID=UPI0026368FC3|nr:hypothetical protein [uncultured Clostridium sp.]